VEPLPVPKWQKIVNYQFDPDTVGLPPPDLRSVTRQNMSAQVEPEKDIPWARPNDLAILQIGIGTPEKIRRRIAVGLMALGEYWSDHIISRRGFA
jgi:hypothetical protein